MAAGPRGRLQRCIVSRAMMTVWKGRGETSAVRESREAVVSPPDFSPAMDLVDRTTTQQKPTMMSQSSLQ